jgi:hypothetical protein
MMATWTKILSYFLVSWFAIRWCERFEIKGQGLFVNPYKGVLIMVRDDRWYDEH